MLDFQEDVEEKAIFDWKEGVEKDNIKYWYKDGVLHGSPAVEFEDGDYMCFREGKYHCINGPAVKINGREFYFLYGIQYSKESYKITLAQIQIGSLVRPDVFCNTVM